MKLPCLGRSDTGELSAKYLRKDPQEVTKLRSEIIRTAVVNFEPDLILVDKKPYGLQGELKSTLTYLKQHFPVTKLVLLLRDILDAPEVTIKDWHQNDYYHALQSYYDQILVVGMPEIFDITKEYRFPISLSKKTKFCGYIRREYGHKSTQLVRQELKVKSKEKLVLVTPGGGGDGYYLVETYLQGLTQLSAKHKIKSLIISGTEMPQDRTQELSQIAQQFSHVQMSEFTDDIASYMETADAVVCMGGYNTICEVISLSKRAVVVPRIKPVQEQWIRAQKMTEFGLFKTIHPSKLTSQYLINSVLEQLERNSNYLPAVARIDLNALPRIQEYILELVFGKVVGDCTHFFIINSTKKSLISVN
ncbi:glycosyltransferase family protein [Pleurocapsa sp. PCC 7327]|uniref:glycosyltransferase family protein n=1 Tax=Pleurocapsa sp. PCC 7327 TaxID=118163 RepID=UPI001C30A757|nr:glycosyltransferase [Pleurocapsa sp. PCC 7327]